MAGIPSCHLFILCIDDKHDAANIRRGQQAASARREQKLSANSLPLEPAIDSQARQAEARYIIVCQPAPYDLRCPGIVNRGWTQTIEAENSFVAGVVDRKERFCTAPVVALAGVTAQEFIQRFFAAVEGFAIMSFADRLLVPCRHDYDRRFGKARAAASSFAFGAGGFSNRSRTRKLSLAESCT